MIRKYCRQPHNRLAVTGKQKCMRYTVGAFLNDTAVAVCHGIFSHALTLKLFSIGYCAVFLFCLPVSAEEICDFSFNECPEEFVGDTVVFPEYVVSLAQDMYVCEAEKVIEHVKDSGGTPSIVFVIDHSYSMMGLCNTFPGNDTYGNRFRVTRDMLDTIYKLHPDAEVGLVVFREVLFFDHRNNSNFVSLPGCGDQSYLPLMKLNRTYGNGQTGIEHIKEILTIDTVVKFNPKFLTNVECVDLKYQPDFPTIGNTNINTAFDAAREAMKSAQYPKKNQFIVFLSDGEPHPLDPAQQGGKDPYYFVKGNNVPTTFTIFFDNDSLTPPSLVTMTDNIKKNGYSSSNPASALWTVKADYETIMKILTKDIFTTIVMVITAVPSSMSVNGHTSTLYSNNYFTFPDRFGLSAASAVTPFVFDITYTITNKTTGQTADTTTHTPFFVKREKDAPFPNDFLKRCWDRRLEFYYKDSLISCINETMEQIEVRFITDPGDADYYYTQASVSITTTESSVQDQETYALKQEGTVFSKVFKQQIAAPRPGDGIVQHMAIDSLVATFRNPLLALDTLRCAIPFRVSKIIEILGATYYDRDADGYIDSMDIALKDPIDQTEVAAVVAALHLPSFRGFTIRFAETTATGIALILDEDKNHTPCTAVTDQDSIRVTQTVITSGNGGWIAATTVPIVDNVAPVITNAVLTDIRYDSTIADTLTITMSERVQPVQHHNPFYFYNPQTRITYTAYLIPLGTQNERLSFCVSKIAGINGEQVNAMERGDSVWINTNEAQTVCDLYTNTQYNPGNVRCPLQVRLVYKPYTFIMKAASPFKAKTGNSPIPAFVLNIPQIKTYMEKHPFLFVHNAWHGMLISVKPDNPQHVSSDESFSATLTILDPVGNAVLRRVPMGYFDGNGNKSKKGLFFVWNGRNSSNRLVGSGAYAVIVSVNRIDKYGECIANQISNALVGIGQ